MAVVNGTSIGETLNGTVDSDTLTGAAGNDTLDGGKGVDTAVYAGNSSDFRFGWSNGYLTITDLNNADGNTGKDSLKNIERLQFTDRLLELGEGGEQFVNEGQLGIGAQIHTTPLKDGGWVVSWHEYDQGYERNTYAQVYDPSGNAVAEKVQLSASTEGEQRNTAITALADGGWLATWEGYGNGDTYGIFAQRFSEKGTPIGAETLINSSLQGNQTSPAVTLLEDGGWVICWDSRTPENSYDILAQRYDSSGIAQGSEITVVSKSYQSAPNVQPLPDGGWLTIWTNKNYGSEYGTYVQRHDSTGTPTTPICHLPKIALGAEDKPWVSVGPDGGWTLLYSGNSASTYYSQAVYEQHYDASGAPAGAATIIGSAPYTPSVVKLPDDSWLLTWKLTSTMYFQRYDADGNRIGDESAINIARSTSMADSFSTAVLPDGGWIFTWTDRENEYPSGNQSIYTQRYDKDGNPQVFEIRGTAGNDTLAGNSYQLKLVGGAGNDTYIIGDPADDLFGQSSFIHESASEGIDTVISYLRHYQLAENVENGRILVTNNEGHLIGNSLNNTLYSNSRFHVLDGGAGIDTANFSDAESGVTISLDDSYKFISIENVTGSAHSDTIFGNAGNNIINGAAGTDTVNYIAAASAVNISLALSTAQATGGAGTDTLISIENLTGTNYNDRLTGSTVSNWLTGGLGNDTLDGGTGADFMDGGEGSDTFYVDNAGDRVFETRYSSGTDTVLSRLSQYTLGTNIENGRILAAGTAGLTGNDLNNLLYAGSGNNALNGGNGNDTVSYLYASSAVTASLSITTAQATGGSGSDTLTAFENLTGSNYNDRLTGNSAGNKLSGGLGNDVLNGGAGADNMIGGDGSDSYYVDHTSDVVSETNTDLASGGTDTVYSYLSSYNLGANVENGRILASAAANLTGNSLNNVLMAGSGNNILNGSAGIDTASYAYATSAVTVSLSSSNAQATKGSGSDTLISIESLIGSNYNDTLTGSATGNVLNGGSGNDRLTGGAGKDTLIGGAGNDVFVFSALTDSGPINDTWDVIKDFVQGTDRIDLSKLDANTAAGGDNAFTKIIGSASAFSAAGQLRLTDGVLYGNTDADADAEFAIQLIGVASVKLADFIA